MSKKRARMSKKQKKQRLYKRKRFRLFVPLKIL